MAVFSLPLGSAHTAMKNAKERELGLMSDLFNHYRVQLLALDQAAGNRRSECASLVEKLQGLKVLSETAA